MESLSSRNFGIIIAYVIPGFIAMTGPFMHGNVAIRGGHIWVTEWLGTSSTPPTIGGVLLLTLVALFFGLVISAVRWLIIDSIHHGTGIKPTRWDIGNLGQRVQGYETMVEFHYRYYQFYANSLLAIIFHYTFRWQVVEIVPLEALLVTAVLVVLFVGSRDCLGKYYKRVASLLMN